MRRALLAGAILLLLLASAQAEEAPWRGKVDPSDRALLDRLLSADEAVREAAADEWNAARIAALPDYGPNHWPPPPVDALSDEVDPLDPWAVRKKRMMTALVTALQEGDTAMRVAAARSIRELAPAYTTVIDALAVTLADEPAAVRLEVLRTLDGISQFSGGRYVDTKLGDVLARVDDEDASVRVAAIELLGRRIGYGDAYDALRRRVLEAALLACEDDVADVRAAALAAALTLAAPADDRVVAAVRRGLDDASSTVRRAATDLIAWRPKGFDAALPRLRALLGDGEFEQRYAAARAIWELSRDATALVPLLAEALERFEGLDLAGPARFATQIGPPAEAATAGLVHALGRIEPMRHFATGREAYDALLSIGPSADIALPAIEEALHRRPPEDRPAVLEAVVTVYAEPERLAAFAVEMLSQYPCPDPAAVESAVFLELGIETPAWLARMREQLASEDPRVVRRAEYELGRMGTPGAVRLLVGRLSDPATRSGALIALRDAGEAGRAAIPEIVRALKTDPELAAAALVRIGGAADPEVVASLLAVLERTPADDHATAVTLCDAIGTYGGDLEPCFDRLIAAFADRNPMTHRAAAAALGRWGPRAERALPHLRKLRAEGGSFYERLAAATAVWQISGEPGPMLEYAVRAAKSSPPRAWMAVHALRLLGPHAAEAVPQLVAAAQARRRAFWRQEDVMKEAVLALGAIGPAAAEALPVLRELERNHLVREEARRAIEQIDTR